MIAIATVVPLGICIGLVGLGLGVVHFLVVSRAPKAFGLGYVDWVAFSDRLESPPDREWFPDQLMRLELTPDEREDYAEATDRVYELTVAFKHETWRIRVGTDDWARIAEWARDRNVAVVNHCRANP